MAIVQSKYRDAAQMEANIDNATPYVGENGNWWRWDVDAEAYVDTGTPARGPQGEKGNKGGQGDIGPPGAPGGVVSAFGRVGDVVAQPGDYTASQVTYTGIPGASDVATALSSLQSGKMDITDHGETPTDLLSTALKQGWHRCRNWTNYPPGAIDGQGHCLVLNYSVGWEIEWTTRIFKDPHTNSLWIRQLSGTWYPWVRLATAESSSQNPFPFSGGITAQGGYANNYWKTQEGEVKANFRCTAASQIGSNITIGTFPVGYRPKNYVSTQATLTAVDNTTYICHVDVDTNGTVNLWSDTGPINKVANWIIFSLCFISA